MSTLNIEQHCYSATKSEVMKAVVVVAVFRSGIISFALVDSTLYKKTKKQNRQKEGIKPQHCALVAVCLLTCLNRETQQADLSILPQRPITQCLV